MAKTIKKLEYDNTRFSNVDNIKTTELNNISGINNICNINNDNNYLFSTYHKSYISIHDDEIDKIRINISKLTKLISKNKTNNEP